MIKADNLIIGAMIEWHISRLGSKDCAEMEKLQSVCEGGSPFRVTI